MVERIGNYKAFSENRKLDEKLDENIKEQVHFERPTLESIKKSLIKE